MRRDERARFDAMFEAVLEAMPPEIHELIEEVPVVLEDHAPRALLEALLAIERVRGRDRAHEQRHGPRTLDLDVLTYGDAFPGGPVTASIWACVSLVFG